MADGDKLEMGRVNNSSKITSLESDGTDSPTLRISNPIGGPGTLEVFASSGQGIFAHADSHAVIGSSKNGVGVFALGVTGVAASADSRPGVVARSEHAEGVLGIGDEGGGVHGRSVDGVGIAGSSQSNHGASGVSTAGLVTELRKAPNGKYVKVKVPPKAAGVSGSSQLGPGVVGSSVSGVGVHGASVTGIGGYFEGGLVCSGGPKAAAVPHPDGSHRLLYSLESPESWFEDFGSAKLVRGHASVKIETNFGKLVHRKEYYVFLTAEGDCSGLYVSRKTPTTFDVHESQGGKHTLRFSYRIVARRGDIAGPRLPKIVLPKSARLGATPLSQLKAPRKGEPQFPEVNVPEGARVAGLISPSASRKQSRRRGNATR
jgi:hypothetical protein